MVDPKLKERVENATKLARHCREYIWKRTKDLDEQGRYITIMTAASILSVELMLDALEGHDADDLEDTLKSFTRLLRANLKEFIDDDQPTQH